MIPKILHQVWIGENTLPDFYYTYKQSWLNLHPEWEYKFWTDSNLHELNIPFNLDDCASLSSRSNIIRLYAIKLFGGIYADVDVEFIKCFNPLLIYDSFIAQEIPKLYCNAVFGATINNLCIDYQINLLDEYVARHPPWGPELFTRAVNECGKTITDLPTKYFYPYYYNEKRLDLKEIQEIQECYCAHHWELSWKNELV